MSDSSLLLPNLEQVVEKLVAFIQRTFSDQKKTQAVIAVSGGIDSALSLALLTKALSPAQITAVSLPYADQSIDDAQTIMEWSQIPADRRQVMNIQPIVEATAQTVNVTDQDKVRWGNLQARARMICVYDLAKKMDALVCGTENKSEHYLGYFTRFGDAASDLEPISTLYKTQVRQLAQHLGIPASIIEKAPSAGLWSDQTDEAEMGFSYEVADQVLTQYVDEQKTIGEIVVEGVDTQTMQRVIDQVESMAFKRHVPYEL